MRQPSGTSRWGTSCSTAHRGWAKPRLPCAFPAIWGFSFQIASGAVLAAPKDLLPYLTNIEERSVLFIDEIHRLPKAVEEFLYPAMEDFRIDVTLGEGVNARTITIQIKPFTLIGATTRTGVAFGPVARSIPDARAPRFLFG